MNLTASDYYTLYHPTECELRVFLRSHFETEAQPSEFDKLIAQLGQRHEKNHLATFKNPIDLSMGSLRMRASRTLKAITSGANVIYQGVFQSKLPTIGDIVTGIPDFLIRDGNNYKIRDCKLARNIDEDQHPEIFLQLELYGWLLEQNTGKPPQSLEVYSGDGEITQLRYDGGTRALEILKNIRSISGKSKAPYSPVGWTKCSACTYKARCWKNAEKSNDVASIIGVDQDTALALRKQKVFTISQLLSKYDYESLSEVRKALSNKRIGRSAQRILEQASVLQMRKETILRRPQLPKNASVVMFDLEGMPPVFEDEEKVYLWGLQVYGRNPSKYQPALGGFGRNGDEQGWHDFLSRAERIFSRYGDIPFVHWASYETTKIKSYIERYGDPHGTAHRVLHNCVDLLKITRDALVLPVHSYGLKIIEKEAGFRRTMKQYGGDWSIVQYFKAVETKDKTKRKKIMAEILRYNEQDLKATWAVFQWLKKK